MTTPQPDQPAMTMRQIRESLGHVKPGQPDVLVQPARYLVSCLPEDHDDRWTFTIQVEYSSAGLYTVKRFLSLAAADGTWERGPAWPETGIDAQQAWLAGRLFDHDAALRLARSLAPGLTYRGRTVTDALANPAA